MHFVLRPTALFSRYFESDAPYVAYLSVLMTRGGTNVGSTVCRSDKIIFSGAQILADPCMELASCHPCGAKNLRYMLKFLEKLCTPSHERYHFLS